MAGPAERLTGSAGWALRVPLRRAAAAAALRGTPGIDAQVAEPWLWLRGRWPSTLGDDAATAALRVLLRSVPEGELLDREPDGRCHLPGALLTAAQLPDGTWRPLRELLPVQLPRTRLPATPTGGSWPKAPLRVVPAPGEPRAANVLLTSLRALHDWAATAPAVRFAGLRFAADARGRALVHAAQGDGAPLPPLPGPTAIEHHGVALAAGCAFVPDLPQQRIAAHHGLERGDLLWCDQHRFELVRGEQFVVLRRSALRASLAAEAP